MRLTAAPASVWNAVARSSTRHPLIVITIWLLAAGLGNLLVPQVESVARSHARSFLPADARVNVAGSAMAAQFHDGGGDNLTYLVVESDHGLGPAEHAFHDELLRKLSADTDHVATIMDLWSDPATEPAAVSPDGRAAYTMLRLHGELGDATANRSVAEVRQTVLDQPAPPGLHAYLTGPAATIADQISSIDKQMMTINAITFVLIAALLLLVYRSFTTAAIPLTTVGIGLGVARPIVAFLGDRNLIEVSIFSIALLAALVLGSATDYAIFLLGRYHEKRRAGSDHSEALALANRSVSPVIGASGLTVAAALSYLVFAHVGMLRSAGIPCAIGILTGMFASLTLLPALLAMIGKRGLAQPRPQRGVPGERWRRLGTLVARWPLPVLVGSTLVLVICALPAAKTRLGFDELATQSPTTHANRGYQAVDRHFPPNRLLPEIVFIKSDHDLRNPAGVIAVERVAKKIMEVPGIRMVLSASRPAGTIPDQATLTDQAGTIGDQIDSGAADMARRLGAINRLSGTLGQFQTAVTQLQNGLAGGTGAMTKLDGGIDVVQTGMRQLQDNVAQVSDTITPLRDFTRANPNCANDGICSLALKVVEPVDSVAAAADSIAKGAANLKDGAQDMTKSLAAAQASVGLMRGMVSQLRSVAGELSDAVGQTRTMFSGLTDYMREVRQDFTTSGEGGFYLPQRAWSDPRFHRASELYFSPDGQSTRMLVYGEGKMFGVDGAHRSADILQAVREATKEGTLAGSYFNTTGFGTGTADLHTYVTDDFMLLAKVALVLVFLIVLVMLRSLVAAAVVIGTVVISYASAVGVSTLIWQDLLGKDLHWPVPSIALIALLAVGADYNLLLTMRMREEMQRGAGLRTGMIRAFGGTGAVVTIAGIVFGISMFALLSGNVLSIQQTGTTIGIGLIIDTLIVRTFMVPALASLLGRWFWWTPMPLLRNLLRRRIGSRTRGASVEPTRSGADEGNEHVDEDTARIEDAVPALATTNGGPPARR